MGRFVMALARMLTALGRLGLALALAFGLTLVFFLILPFLEQVGNQRKEDLEVRSVASVSLPPPPPPPANEPPKEEARPETPPELPDLAAPLDLAQLELALNPGGAGDGVGGDFAVRLPGAATDRPQDAGQDAEAVFSLEDLDQAPRVVHQPPPDYPAELRKRKLAGSVHVLFLVDPGGRVVNPLVQKSTNPAFDRPALEAVRKWRFEPGKRNGAAVSFRMRVPITFMGG